MTLQADTQAFIDLVEAATADAPPRSEQSPEYARNGYQALAHILGEGPERARLHEKIASLGVESVIRLHGTVPDPFQFYRRADIFVLASRHEGTPNAALEALGCRLPSILSDQALGSLELIGDARPLIVPTGDAAALEQALERLITDQPLRQTMADAAPLQIAEFQLDRVRLAWETVLAG